MSRIRYLVSYDICQPKRLRRVARTLEGFGVRLQYSVFECALDAMRLAKLKAELQDVTGKRESGLDVATHSRNFLDCVKSRGLTAANSQVMRHSHIACHAAAFAWVLNRKLKFDPVKEEFIGDDEANGLRVRPARTPWVF